jgi:hypothetical protein
VRNLKSETDTINAVEKLKNKMSKNTESSGFVQPINCLHLQQTVGEWKIRMVIRFGPGKKVPRPPSCSCYIPDGQAPECPNANIGFEDGTFNGWLGRTGKYCSSFILSAVSQGLDFCGLSVGIVGASYGDEPARHLMVTKGGI